MKRFLYILLTFSSLIACERDTQIDLPKAEPQLVIEGTIDAGDFAYVSVTKSSSYFDPVDFNSLYDLAVTNALVTVTHGTTIDTLKRMSKLVVLGGFIYKGQKIIGQVGEKYHLTVKALGKTVTGTTTIIKPLRLDSLWYLPDDKKEDKVRLWARLIDPDTLGNSYILGVKRMGKDDEFLRRNDYTFDDQFFNGKSYDFPIVRPNTQKEKDNQSPTPNPDSGVFSIGDVIVVRNSTVDRQTYKYWKNIAIQQQAANNPFGQPSNVKGNINGGLGVWAGYSATYDTVIVK